MLKPGLFLGIVLTMVFMFGCEHEARLDEVREERAEWAKSRKARLQELEDTGMSREDALRAFGREDSFKELYRRQDEEAGVSDSIRGAELKNRTGGR